jgi:hypothetical protein
VVGSHRIHLLSASRVGVVWQHCRMAGRICGSRQNAAAFSAAYAKAALTHSKFASSIMRRPDDTR